MMNSDFEELRKITLGIVDPQKELIALIHEAEALRDFFESRTQFSIDPGHDIAAGERRLDSGLAISPTLAAMCVRELFRTPAFIRGVFAAINNTLPSDRPIHLLYAGCGPYALLALPLMTVFTAEQLRFTLIDIHRESLDRAVALIESFGLSSHLNDALCTDATRHTIPAGKAPDIIVSETMAVCLHNEPQVAIARNLLSQAPDAHMVPQSVSVEVCLMDWSREHQIMPSDYVGKVPEPNRGRINLGKIFELNAANINRWQNIGDDYLPAGRVTIPSPLECRYKPYLLTNITVYENHRLQDYDCSLTAPQPLHRKINQGEVLQFRYRLGNHPQLLCDVVAQGD